MKENKKVGNVLQKYMQWPVVLSALVLCANGAVGLVSGKAGMVMAVFTVLYAFCAGVLFWYGKKRIRQGLWALPRILTRARRTDGFHGAALRHRR